MIQFLKRNLKKPNWHFLRNTRPLSTVFGLDRGLPVDRYYIERFLDANRSLISGRVLEVGEDLYAKRYGSDVERIDILHVDSSNRHATIVGDLARPNSLPSDLADCFICTQTLNFIFDLKAAIHGIHTILKPGGTVLATAAGICQISRYDMDRWGDFWRFTPKSLERLFSDHFGADNVTVASSGNVLSAIALLEGLAAEELSSAELDYYDADYPVVLTVKAVKR